MTEFIYRCGCCNDTVRVKSDVDFNGKDLSEVILKMETDKRVLPKIPRVISHKCNRYNANEVGLAKLVGIYYRNDFSEIFY